MTSPLKPEFRDVAWLGAGAFGEVYRAIDAAGRPVAVKTLAAKLVDQPEQVWQFKAEFRKLSRLEHPAFPAAYEEGLTPAGEPYYTMALGQGRPPAGPMPASEVRRVLVALAEALAYLHRGGQVHGDLKPENVLVAEDGAVTLLDVGLMVSRGAARETIAGTLEYLAPELLRRAPAEPRQDLYALGVIGYELLAGRPPFRGTPAELVRAHLQETPAPLPAETDRPLATLLMRLLEKDPARRPASAEAVLAALAGQPEPVAARGLTAAPWIGREAVREAWQGVLSGGGWLTLAGGSGLGKTRALDECRLLAQVAGRAWIGVGCGGDAPAGPVRAIVRQALALAKETPSPLLAAWLSGAMPAELQALEPAARQLAIQHEVTTALDTAAVKAGGLAIGLDDWHAADDASRDVIGRLRNRPVGAGLAWVLTQESEAAETPIVALTPLTEPEVEALLTARLASAPPAALTAYLAPAAQGNPGLLTLLLDYLVAEGQLTGDAQGWRFANTDGASSLPRSAAAVWRGKLDALSAEARRLAEVLAVAAPAGGLPVPAASQVAGLESPDAALAALAASGLVTLSQGEARLAVAGLADVLLEDVPAGTQARWAGTLARAVLGDHALETLPLDQLSRGAWLALAGDDDALALASATEAGCRALALSVPKKALKLLDGAVAKLPPDAPAETRLAVYLPRAEAERFADRLADATTDYQLAADLADSLGRPVDAARALIGLAKCRQMQGGYAPALEALAGAAERAHGRDDTQEARALAAEARIRVFQGESALAVSRCEAAVALARRAQDRPVLTHALTLLGVLTVQASPEAPEAGLAMLEEAFTLCEAVGDRLGAGTALENKGNAFLALGDLTAAADVFGRYVAILAEAGQETDALGARFNQAIVAAERGELTLAVSLATGVVALATRVGRKFPLAAAQTVLGQAAWRQGRPHEAMPALDQALETVLAIKNAYLEEHVRLHRLEALLALGEAEAAGIEAEAVVAIVEATGHAEGKAHLETYQAELELLAGQPDAAMALAAAHLESANRVIAHRAYRVFARAAGMLEMAEESVAMARAALAIAQSWSSPWHTAADSLLLARGLMQTGERGEALALARGVLNLPVEDPHPYARAGAALLVAEFGNRVDDRQLAEACTAALERSLEPLDEAARRKLLTAQAITSLGVVQGPRVTGSGAIDVLAFTSALERVALETEEEALIRVALDAAIALIGADRGYLLAYEDGRLSRIVTRAFDYEGEGGAHFSQSIVEHALFGGEPIYLMNASADADWSGARSVAALELKTVVCLPVAAGEDMLGVLYMDRELLEPVLTPTDLTMLSTLATFMAAGVFRARSRAEARRSRLTSAYLGALAAGTAPALATRKLLDAALAASGAERAFILTREPEGRFVAEHAVDASGAPLASDNAVISQGVADKVYERQEALTVLDASSDTDWEARASVQALGLRSIWCVPLGGLERLLYLDTTRLVQADPVSTLRDLETLVACALPLLKS